MEHLNFSKEINMGKNKQLVAPKNKTFGQKLKKCLGLDDKGREKIDPRPVAMPVGFGKPPSMQERIRELFKAERELYESEKEFETFEDADDFDIGDDYDPASPFELSFDPEEPDYSKRAITEDVPKGDPKAEEQQTVEVKGDNDEEASN
jgi:hypothetical protein